MTQVDLRIDDAIGFIASVKDDFADCFSEDEALIKRRGGDLADLKEMEEGGAVSTGRWWLMMIERG